MLKQYLEAGKIVATHGIRGDLRVECWCDEPSFLSDFKVLYLQNGEKSLKVKCRPHKNISLMKIDGVDTIEDAMPYIGKILYIKREDVKLEEGRYFVQDLIGLEVRDVDTDEIYGKIKDVIKTGANDVYEMKDNSDKLVYIPVIDDIVKKRNFEKNVVYIKPMKGLFDDED